VDAKSEIREFLTSRRDRITPEQAGLPTFGTGPQRVTGLRREEVALIAGVSVDYYTRLERGDLSGASARTSRPRSRPTSASSGSKKHVRLIATRTVGDGLAYVTYQLVRAYRAAQCRT
jgi:hypothetical protein